MGANEGLRIDRDLTGVFVKWKCICVTHTTLLVLIRADSRDSRSTPSLSALIRFSAPIRVPNLILLRSQAAGEDGLFAAGADGDEFHRGADQFAHAVEVLKRGVGELG